MLPPVRKNPHIETIAVLQSKPGKEDALDMLKRIAHNVSYLMKEEKFKVKQLVEFYPKDRSLLGMNVNRGMKIMLRLRDPLNEHQFLPMESLMGTMLHELTHNLHGPHDRTFYEKLDQLMGRQWSIEQMGLYDSFVGNGNRLGRVPKGVDLVSRTYARGKGRKLGGSRTKTREAPRRSAREMAAIAADKRIADNKVCSQQEEDLIPSQEELVVEILDEGDHQDIDDDKVEIIDLT